jgi:hypothetical protein
MDDYIAKPVRTQTLNETLRRWIDGTGSPVLAAPARKSA